MPPAHLKAPSVEFVPGRHDTGCTGKMRYPTANDGARAAKAMGNLSYRCAYCFGWHLTREDIRSGNAAQARRAGLAGA